MRLVNLTCWPVRYAQDPFLRESRNVGLIVHREGRTHCVMLGEAGHAPDPRYFCHVFGFSESAGWIYLEWVRWFKGLAADASGIDAIQNELDRLSEKGARFSGGEPFTASAPAEERIATTAQRLLAETVSIPTLPRRSQFDTDLETVIVLSEMERSSTFHRDVELEILKDQAPIFVRLPIFIEAPRRVGIKLLRYERTTDNEMSTQANDILYSFDALTASGILERERCVVLHDRPTRQRERHLDRVGNHARLLLLGHPNTPAVLRELAIAA